MNGLDVSPDLVDPWTNLSRSPLFWIFVLGVVISILANLIVYYRRVEGRGPVDIGLGRLFAFAGGFITLISTLLPWFTGVVGLAVFPIYVVVLDVFGVLWLTWIAIPKKVAAILGIFWGGVTLLLIVLALAGVASIVGGGASPEYGLFVGITGSIVLFAGSVLAYLQAAPAKQREPIKLEDYSYAASLKPSDVSSTVDETRR
ncbi:MAG TPA: hypothetical protein VEO20_03120 [Thermoplasmata archaeon]|nr:hypothetical protein [Thermoplasmata archaeon]